MGPASLPEAGPFFCRYRPITAALTAPLSQLQEFRYGGASMFFPGMEAPGPAAIRAALRAIHIPDPEREDFLTEKQDDQPKTTFAALGLGPKILQAIEEAGYDSPTPIQAQAVPHVLLGGDVTGIAQTGTGKTAAFVLPMIHRLEQGRARARMPRTLILAPTRELAAQVSENFEKYGKHLKLEMALLIGGVSFKE